MSGVKKLRSEMTEEERERERRKAKHVSYLRQSGKPQSCTPEETARGLARTRRLLHRHGMSAVQIAERSGLSTSTVRDYLRGGRGEGQPIRFLPRESYDAIMACPVVEPDGNALLPLAGSLRRAQALLRAGYTLGSIGEMAGFSSYQRVWQIAHETYRWVRWSTAKALAEAYEKYEGVTPEDYGIPEHVAMRGRLSAERKGFAPARCWDEDTIDDPNAFPEWTGACGTVHGRSVHEREGIPICQPCRDAKAARKRELETYEFDRDRFSRLMERNGYTVRSLASTLDIHHVTVWGWRSGKYRPMPERLEDLADLFGVHVSELRT
jgi:transcriptional regulator with XRE-family HTH domain